MENRLYERTKLTRGVSSNYVRTFLSYYPQNECFEPNNNANLNTFFKLHDANLILYKRVVVYNDNGIRSIHYLFKYNVNLDYADELNVK